MIYHMVNLASQVFYEISVFGKLACDTCILLCLLCVVYCSLHGRMQLYVHHGFIAQVNFLITIMSSVRHYYVIAKSQGL